MMDSVQLLSREMGTVSTPIPTAGLVISTVLSMMTMAILAVCLSEFHGRRISRNFLTILPSSENTSDEELVQSSVNKMAYDHDFHSKEFC
jgi:hypothetical protein